MVERIQKYYNFAFIPYIEIKSDIKFSNVIFWSFEKEDSYISDERIKIHIKNILNRYVDYTNKKPLKKITMVSYESPDNFIVFNEQQIKEIKEATFVLSFCSIIRNVDFRAFPSDNFQIVFQNFVPGDTSISISSGSYIHNTIGGPKLDEVLFITPYYITQGWGYVDYDERLFESILALKNDLDNEELFARIIRALEWVYHAYSNVSMINFLSRIIMMSTAFELLFNGIGGRKDFTKKIKKHSCNVLDDRDEYRETRIMKINGKEEEVELSLKEWWAYDFYILRNNIVHGNTEEEIQIKNEKGFDYFLLSINFFEESLKRILSEYGYYEYTEVDEISWASIYDKV